MSNLKYQSVKDLKRHREACEVAISNLKSNLNGQKERLKWIEHYLFEKTPQEMTMTEIEAKLGHKVIIK